ncbi:MAG: hypothetical protein ACE5HX_06180 [bacterium]
MKLHLCTTTVCVIAVLLTGCVKRIPVYDEAGKPISEKEIKQYQKNNKFLLYTFAGGALSFGTGFFLGTLLDRGIDDARNNVALWGTTAGGTLIGTVIFARQGKLKDRNDAIETIKENRKNAATKLLTEQKSKRQQINEKLKELEKVRAKQEAEKNKLKAEIKKKKKSKKKINKQLN